MGSVNKNIEFDSEKLTETADNIYNLLIEYEKIINQFFSRINFSEGKSAWTGNNAILYANMAMEDKLNYLDYGKGIKEIAKEMKNFASELDSQIVTNEEICENSQDSYVSYFYY